MIVTHLQNQDSHIFPSTKPVLDDTTIWIDMIDMSPEEEKLVEGFLGIDIPNREEMAQIEVSNRLYIRDGAVFVTILLTNCETIDHSNHTVTLILHHNKLITVRYSDLKPFKVVTNNLTGSIHTVNAIDIFVAILDIMVARLADILEDVRKHVDGISRVIFFSKKKRNYRSVLQKIGHNGSYISKTQESLLSFVRAINFLLKHNEHITGEHNMNALNIILADLHSIVEHANALSSEVTFLLDASLGMIGIEQNKLINFLSVVSVIFLPPTLIGTIYGMNFDFMPELKHHYGYFVAIAAMVLSAWLPYKILKWNKWL